MHKENQVFKTSSTAIVLEFRQFWALSLSRKKYEEINVEWFKVPMSPNLLLFYSKVHIKKGTSAKIFFDLNKTRIFYDFLNPTFVWYIPSADRESTGSYTTSCDVVSGTLVAVSPVFTINERPTKEVPEVVFIE